MPRSQVFPEPNNANNFAVVTSTPMVVLIVFSADDLFNRDFDVQELEERVLKSL